MSSYLTWVDFSSADRQAMREVLKLFNEPGTVDDLGLGTLRDMFSDAFFPGVSTIHTRLRYVFFIPYLYQQLEARATLSDASARARRGELALIAVLQKGLTARGLSTTGVIGGDAGDSLSRLPSEVYWGALSRWGLFQAGESISRYHTRLSRQTEKRLVRETLRADDKGIAVDGPQGAWHPDLEPLYRDAGAHDFPKDDIGFDLTSDEAEFLLARWRSRCDGSLLLALAEEQDGPFRDDSLWDHPQLARVAAELRHTIELARQFALQAHGMQLVYNLLVAERLQLSRKQPATPAARTPEHYRNKLHRWADEQEQALDQWRSTHPAPVLDTLLAMGIQAGTVKPRTETFLRRWEERLQAIGPSGLVDDAVVRDVIRNREVAKKGRRSRFENTERLHQWGGESGTTRMVFRWREARSHLDDLFRARQGGL